VAAVGATMRAGLGVLIVIVISLPELARSQAVTDTDTAHIAIHPDVSTILQLPDEIVDTWIEHHGEIRVARVGNEIAIRPRAGTPAGVEAVLEVETRTAHRTFRLLVVARLRDAHRDVLVLPAGDEQDALQSIPDGLSVTPAEQAAPAEQEPAASASTNESGPALAPERVEPAAERDVAADMERGSTSDAARDILPTSSPRFDIAAHAVVGLGFTGLEISGYRAGTTVQPHQALGLRLTGARPGASWALEANVGGEWPAGSMLYVQRTPAPKLEVSGPRLRLEVGMRAGLGTKWRASAYGGVGIQVHLRRIQETASETESTLTMEKGAVLALGIGLQYRARHRLLLGVDFQVRQEWPDDYHSVTALLTVGRFLDQGK
jgi:hypothetical protein